MCGKPLIICYSYTGNTWRVAEEIQRQTQGVLCGIYPKQPYPMVFEKLLIQVRKEIQTGFLPGLFPIGEDPRDYDNIFLGTPNWCGTIAPPLASFLEKHDFTGKKLLPFFSHCGGGPANITRDIQNLCPAADVRRQIGVVNDGGADLKADIAYWIAEKN